MEARITLLPGDGVGPEVVHEAAACLLAVAAARGNAALNGFADRWESSADKQTHTFHIREGMKWSDGEPATCEDARWTYQFVLDVQASEAGYVGSGYLEPYLMNAGLKSVTCADAQNLINCTSRTSRGLEERWPSDGFRVAKSVMP